MKAAKGDPLHAWCDRCRALTLMVPTTHRIVQGVSVHHGRCACCRDEVLRIGGAMTNSECQAETS